MSRSRLARRPARQTAHRLGASVAVLSLLIAPLSALLVQWLAKALKRANRRAMEEMAEIYTTLEETFRGIKIVKAFTNEPQQRDRFRRRSPGRAAW